MRNPNPAQRRYVRRLFIAMLGYVASLAAAVYLFRHSHLATPIAWTLALLPAVCVGAVFWAIGRLIVEEEDEFMRMLVVRQVLFASGFTMVVVSTYGFLENFGLVGQVDAFYAVMTFFFGLGLGAVWNRMTLGVSGCA